MKPVFKKDDLDQLDFLHGILRLGHRHGGQKETERSLARRDIADILESCANLIVRAKKASHQ